MCHGTHRLHYCPDVQSGALRHRAPFCASLPINFCEEDWLSTTFLTPNLAHVRQPSGFEYSPLGWVHLLQTNSVNHLPIFSRKLSIALHFLLMKNLTHCCGKLWISMHQLLSRLFSSYPSVALDLTLESHPLSKVQLFNHLKADNSFFKGGLPSTGSQ